MLKIVVPSKFHICSFSHPSSDDSLVESTSRHRLAKWLIVFIHQRFIIKLLKLKQFAIGYSLRLTLSQHEWMMIKSNMYESRSRSVVDAVSSHVWRVVQSLRSDHDNVADAREVLGVPWAWPAESEALPPGSHRRPDVHTGSLQQCESVKCPTH